MGQRAPPEGGSQRQLVPGRQLIPEVSLLPALALHGGKTGEKALVHSTYRNLVEDTFVGFVGLFSLLISLR